MSTLWQDLRYGWRMLRQSPSFTAMAVLSLALGIGANIAIFSVVNAVLLRPLPYREPDRLIALSETNAQQGSDLTQVSLPNLQEWQARNQSFEQIAAFGFGDYVLTGRGEPARLAAVTVSANLFPLLGAQAAQGRTFLAAEDQPGGHPVAVVSHRFWQQRLHGEPHLLGQTITLDDRPYTVIGIMPSSFQWPDDRLDVWLPLGPDTAKPFFKNRAVHLLHALGRLKAGVTLAQARTEMEAIARRIEQQHPGEDPGHSVKLVSFHELLVGDVRLALLVLLGAVAVVLLIACANVANLLLARAATRQPEMAIRRALGAGRFSLVRQLLTESLLLALLGGAIGVLLAMWGVDLLRSQLPTWLPRVSEISVNGPALGFALMLSLLTGLLFGLAPAWQAVQRDLSAVLKESGKPASSSRNRLRSMLVVAEVALALVLLIGAGLLIKSFWRLINIPPGFQADHLLTMTISLPPSKYSARQQVIDFYKRLPARLGALPGVQAVSAVNRLPISGGDSHGELTIEGRPFTPGEAPGVSYRRILPNYFRALGVPLLRGREFDERDEGGRPDVVIINETMARRYWPTSDAIGQRIKIGPSGNEPWLMVVGVVGDVRHVGLAAEPDLATFEPHAKRPWSEMKLLVRTHADPLSVTAAVRQELQAAEKELLIEDLSTMTQRISASVAPQRLNLALLGLFAAVALMLAAVGTYGVMAYVVAQRTREIGIRLALGAQSSDVLKLVIREGLRLTLIGVGLGLIGALALTRLMKSLLFGVSATDPLTFGGVALLLTVVALLACYLPARRAAKVDPMMALRYE